MKSIVQTTVCICLVLTAGCSSSVRGPQTPAPGQEVIRAFATDFLEQIKAEDWAQAWRGAVIAKAYYVEQSKGQPWNLGLKPVWYAEVEREGNSVGYLIWESSRPHRLIEFGVDAEKPFVSNGKRCQGLEGVPNLQQFPVTGQIASRVASGCVPTSAANVLAYWVEQGFPEWQGEAVAGQHENRVLEMLAKRLRNAMPVTEIRDTVGYTDASMPLTTAWPLDLVKAIVEDAKKHDVQVEVSSEAFSPKIWKREIKAKRPVLLSCVVRLPHKPHLSWGHEVTGIGWTVINGDFFVIVHDNFYPTGKANAARWVRAEALGPIITVAPR